MNQRKAHKHGYRYGLYGVEDRNCYIPTTGTNLYKAWRLGVAKGQRKKVELHFRDRNSTCSQEPNQSP